jgi:hypothetical protein
MSTPPASGTISAAGAINGVELPFPNFPDTEALCVISGTFTSAVLFFDAARDGGEVFFPILAIRQSDLAMQVCDPSGVATADNTTRAWRLLKLEACNVVRVWAYSLGSGAIDVQISSGSYFR